MLLLHEAPPTSTTPPPSLVILPAASTPPPPRVERWLWLGVLALLLHVPLVFFLGSLGQDEVVVRVVEMSPAPETELRLGEEAQLRIDLRLDLAPDAPAPSPLGARLYFVGADGARELVALARVDAADHGHLTFETPRREGSYQVWLAGSGPAPLLGGSGGAQRFVLDGELVRDAARDGAIALPSGDGEPGGDFVAVVRVADRPLEPSVVAANIVSEVPDPEPSTAGESAEPVDAPPTPAVATVEPPIEPPATQPEPSRRAASRDTTPTPPTPEPPVALPPLVENELPVPDRPLPEKEAEISDVFQANAADLDAIIGDEADAMARALEAERARSGALAGWEEELARTQGTFNGDGPKVRPGNQQAVSTHRKEIFEYIALMHKMIHDDWADTYLIHLDLTQRDPTNPISDPNLRTVLEIEMAEDGEVSDVQIVASSGVQTYDAEAIRIAWASGPREPVPETMLSPNGHAYLHWSFHRDQRQCGTFGVEVFVLDEDGSRDSIGFDQEKVLAEEERLGVREQSRRGGASSDPQPGSPATPPPAPAAPATVPSHAGHGHGDAPAGAGDDAALADPIEDGAESGAPPTEGAEGDEAEGDEAEGDEAKGDEGGARPQQRRRKPRPQTRKRGTN